MASMDQRTLLEQTERVRQWRRRNGAVLQPQLGQRRRCFLTGTLTTFMRKIYPIFTVLWFQELHDVAQEEKMHT